MPDLIDRQVIIDLIDAELAGELSPVFAEALQRARDLVSVEPAVVPQIVANISGGVLQGASATHRVEIVSLDFDTDTFDEDNTGVIIDGSEAYRSIQGAEVDPDFVREVIEAEEVFLHNGEPVE